MQDINLMLTVLDDLIVSLDKKCREFSHDSDYSRGLRQGLRLAIGDIEGEYYRMRAKLPPIIYKI
jgi:hypothetical protein